MRLGGTLTAALGTALLIVLALSTTVAASFEWQSREGTVKWAEGLADGTHVYLDAVEISKIRAQQSPAYIVIAECFSWRDKLVAFTQPGPELRVGQTVDVEGDLITTESGDRALTNVTVWGYTDSAGTLLYHGPLIKGLLEPTPWDYKVNLTVDSSALRSETPSEPGEVTTDSSTEVQVCATIADVKANNVGTVVVIRCHPVSTGGTGSFILGEDGNTDTLTTNYTGTVSQAARVCVVSGTIDTTDGIDRVLDVDSGPNYNVQESFQGSILTASQGSVAWVKSWADGHTFAAGDITGKIITRNWTDYLYIEDDTRACGIRVEKTAHGHVKGEVVSVEGTLATNADGERYIAATTITQTGTGELTPLGMNNKWLGGGDFAYDPGPPVVGQRGIVGAAGLNNIGLLVRTWGKVTELDMASPAQWFLISDGSNVQTKVAYPPFAYAVDDYVTISGISSCEVDTNGDLQRVLRPQPLTCAINQATGQSDPTNTSPVNFTVNFSEPVTGFDDADDVSITGTCGGLKTITITQTDTEGMHYNVAVSDLTVGTVIATVPAGKAVNSSGVWNYESAGGDAEVTYQITDSTPPTTPNVVDDGETVAYPVLPVTTNSLHASWVAEDPESSVSLYEYRIIEINGTQETIISGPTTTSSSDITVPNLSLVPGRTYYFGVKAQNGAGLWSDEGWSDGITCKQVIYVKKNSPNTPDGLTWVSAYHSIGAALSGSVAGKEIWVAGGFTYVDNITMTSGAEVFGKFLGTEGVRPFTRLGGETIIDGNNVGTVVTFVTGADSDTVIDGFTIQRENAPWYASPISAYAGGGIYCADSSYPTISNNTIKNNTATAGGAIYCTNSDPLVYGNVISSNSCSSGSGIYLYNSSAWIDNNTISGNLQGSGSGNGGGIYCYGGAPTITDNTITANQVNGHGPGIACSSSSPWITDNTISNNTALGTSTGYCGGGIYILACFDVYISDNTISGNKLPWSGKGGGMYIERTSGEVQCNYISSNCLTDYTIPNGGGVYCYGNLTTLSSLVISANTVSNNKANKGGGISLYATRAKVDSNLISGNSMVTSGGGIDCDGCSGPIVNNMVIGNGTTYYAGPTGGGIHCTNGTTSAITNNTLVNNFVRSDGNGGGIACDGTNTTPTIVNNIVAYNSVGGFYKDSSSNPTHNHNCIVMNSSYDYSPLLTRGPTDIQAGILPGFVDYSGGNFHLAYGSPCIDTGLSTGAPTADYDGDIRDANVDIGADEYVSN